MDERFDAAIAAQIINCDNFLRHQHNRNPQVAAALIIAACAFALVRKESVMAKRNKLDSDSLSAAESTSGSERQSIGPSDSSDAGSDLAGLNRDDDTDREGTGERLGADVDSGPVGADGDIGVDRVVDADEAGLGGGLDQAEEAILGITDEEIAELSRRGR